MRFRRSIIASLAPLIGLTALLAAASADTGASSVKPLIRLLQSRLLQSLQTVAQLAAPSSDYAVTGASHEREAAQHLLDFTALAVTPLGHSLWMVAQRPSIDLLARRHLLVPLRC